MKLFPFERTLWYILGFAMGLWCADALGATPAGGGLFDEIPVLRKADYGHPILNDIESRVRNDKWARNMRNQNDIGNWVHEQTHNLNAKIGIAKKAQTRKHGWTSAYVLGGKSFVALQPGIKLTDVGAAVPEEARGGVYKNYLSDKQAIGAWNNWPLYVLDETSAAANALEYERAKKGQHYDRRRALALDWASMNAYLIVAIEKGDPDYPDLDRLRRFVECQNTRIRRLAGIKPTTPKPAYKLW